MTYTALSLHRSQISALHKEAARQADYHHGRHCPDHDQVNNGSAGCALWSQIQAWCQSTEELLILSKGVQSTDLSLLLRAVNNTNNSATTCDKETSTT